MITRDVEGAARAVLKILSLYKGAKVAKNERAVDLVFLSYLVGAGFVVRRQHYVWMYGSKKPHRIDFRVSGKRRSVIELAVRPPGGGYELSAEKKPRRVEEARTSRQRRPLGR
jgi:hypothetical protein